MVIWGDLINPRYLSADAWEEKYAGAELFDPQGGAYLRRDPSNLSRRGAQAARVVQGTVATLTGAIFLGKRKFLGDRPDPHYGKEKLRKVIISPDDGPAPRSLGKMPYYRNKRKYRKKRRSRSRRSYKKSRRRSLIAAVKKVKNESPIQNYRKFSTGRSTTAVNLCDWFSISHLTNDDVKAIINNTLPTMAISGGKLWHDMSNTASRVKVKSQGGFVEYMFTNNHGFDAVLTFYQILPKYNHSTSPNASFEAGLDKYVVNSTGVAITDAEDKIMYWPSDSVDFKTMWKIVKKQKVWLKPGATFSFRVNIPKGIYNVDAMTTDVETYIKGISTNMFWRQEGTTCHAKGAESQVGLGDTDIDWICKMNWNYKFTQGLYVQHSEFNYDTDPLPIPEQIQQDVEMVEAPQDAA